MATQLKSFTGKALIVDLTDGSVNEYPVSDRERTWLLGNKSLAAKILYDCLAPGLDPFGPDNHLVVTNAVLTGTGAPCSSRFNVSTKSPLTGIILSANCGGNFGVYLKRAGLDALIVKGCAEKPTYLVIDDGRVRMENAEALWGMDTEKAQEALTKLHGKKSGKMVIGPAGENLVRYACIISEERAIGRGGAGAVMGSKNLKGMVALGSGKIEVADPEGFKKANKAWIDYLKNHPVTGQALPAYGTAGLLLKASTLNVLPTRNFSSGHFEHAAEICGEALAEKHLVKNDGCLSCPIRCARVVEVDGKQIKGPEFETLGMFGSNIENRNLGLIKSWNLTMDRLGLDTISCGGVFGFAMEATQKGLMKTDLVFGKTDNIEKTITDIAYRRGIGNDLAEGVMRLSEKYGGTEFAMHSKGMEFAAYEPRGAVGHGLGYATANRGGCHLNSGYLVYFEALGPVNFDPLTPKAKPEYVIFQQNTLEALSACGSCIFTSYAVIPPQAHTAITPYGFLGRALNKLLLASAPVIGVMVNLPGAALPIHLPMIPHSKAIALASGQKMSAGLFMEAGARGYNLERMFNVREGMVMDTLPRRLTEEHQIPGRPETRVPLDRMLPRYYQVRGWDKRGVPRKKTLKALGLDFTLADVPGPEFDRDQLFERFTRRRLAYESEQKKFIAQTVAHNVKRYGS